MTETTNDPAEPATNSGCVLEYDDLRDWLAVEAKGDLKTVTAPTIPTSDRWLR